MSSTLTTKFKKIVFHRIAEVTVSELWTEWYLLKIYTESKPTMCLSLEREPFGK